MTGKIAGGVSPAVGGHRKEFTLRPYQEEAIRAVQSDWAAGIRSVLVTAASGTGKTEIFSALLAEEFRLRGNLKTRALILCHRRDLITQARARLEMRFPSLASYTGTVMAEQDEADCQIIYSTVQTLISGCGGGTRLASILHYGPIDYVIRDEAHRAVTKTDKTLLDLLRSGNPNLLHLGVTATPVRFDKKGLVEVYEKQSYHYGIRQAVEEAMLVPPKWLAIQTGIDVSRVKKYKGDFSARSLADVYETSNCFELVVETHRQYADGKQAICFTASVAGAYALAAAFRREGYSAAAADGSSNKQVRRTLLGDFRAGKIDILCNCQLWTEGLDVPNVSCVHQVRPTRSDGAYLQMVGRGLRTAPGKTECLILDYCPEDFRNVVMLGDVLGVPARKDVYIQKDRPAGTVIGGFTYDGGGVDWLVGDANELVSRELDYLDNTDWSWFRGKDGTMSLGLGEARDRIGRTLFIAPTEDGYVLHGVAKKGKRYSSYELIAGSLEAVMVRAETSIAKYGNKALVQKKKAWRTQPSSHAQHSYAARLGIPWERSRQMTKGSLSQLISHKIAQRTIAR